MKIISLHNGHDSSVTAFEDGAILYHWELERVLNEKHFCAFDKSNEVAEVLYKHCLPILQWKVEDVDILVFGGKSEWKKTEFNGKVPQYTNGNFGQPWEKGRITLRNSSKEIDTYAIEHHINHAAYAYYTSPFGEAIVYSYDGFGDDTASISCLGYGNKLKYFTNAKYRPLDIREPHNAIGLTYSYLFKVFPFLNKGTHVELSCAGKIMGLSSYGKPRDEWRKAVRSVLTEWMPRPERLIAELSLNTKDLSDPMNKVAQDLAATIQDEAELLVLRQIHSLQALSLVSSHISIKAIENVCIVGGCGLNVQINTRLLKEGENIKNVYIPPATSDCGIGIGAGLYVWYNILDNKRNYEWHNPYKGDTLYNSPDDIEGFDLWMSTKYPTLKYKRHTKDTSMVLSAATSLYNNKIIAWAQGRCEIGPRALGNRSIIANPCHINSKDIVNAKVKHREFWRPFAPIALKEEAYRHFDIDHEQPYMLEAPLAKEGVDKLVPAVVHVDMTARVQTVTKENNELLFLLLRDFKMLKNVGILLNTSLNDRGKPIANDLKDILNLLRDTELDKAYVGLWEFSK